MSHHLPLEYPFHPALLPFIIFSKSKWCIYFDLTPFMVAQVVFKLHWSCMFALNLQHSWFRKRLLKVHEIIFYLCQLKMPIRTLQSGIKSTTVVAHCGKLLARKLANSRSAGSCKHRYTIPEYPWSSEAGPFRLGWVGSFQSCSVGHSIISAGRSCTRVVQRIARMQL